MEGGKFRGPRRKNFTDLECGMIIEAISKNRDIYIGKFSPTITKETKAQAWEELAIKVNAACEYGRTDKEIEKKWYNLQQLAVKEVSHFNKESRKTGNYSLLIITIIYNFFFNTEVYIPRYLHLNGTRFSPLKDNKAPVSSVTAYLDLA